MTNIVQINVSQQQAPTPNTLQRKGAIVSQGWTTAADNSLTLIPDLATLIAMLTPGKAVTGITRATNVATVTTTAPHGFTNGNTIPMTLAGFTPASFNGTVVATVTGASTFTYPNTGSNESTSVQGTYVPAQVASFVLAAGTTFFAQGNDVAPYVIELGYGTAAQGVTDLTAWLTNNPKTVSQFLIPGVWIDETSMVALAGNYTSPESITYFQLTDAGGLAYSDYADQKSAIITVPAPDELSGRWPAAATFYNCLKYNPSTTNLVTPLAFAYVFGVTPYPTVGNAGVLAAFKAAGVNTFGTGAEGGISNTILLYGTTMDQRDFNYWFSADWAQINLELDLANAVINGSNDPINPLYFDQDGINRLQAKAQGTLNRGITFGMLLPPATVEAVPFLVYVADNPSDYPIGKYAGLSARITPRRGFQEIIFNLVITDFITG